MKTAIVLATFLAVASVATVAVASPQGGLLGPGGLVDSLLGGLLNIVNTLLGSVLGSDGLLPALIRLIDNLIHDRKYFIHHTIGLLSITPLRNIQYCPTITFSPCIVLYGVHDWHPIRGLVCFLSKKLRKCTFASSSAVLRVFVSGNFPEIHFVWTIIIIYIFLAVRYSRGRSYG